MFTRQRSKRRSWSLDRKLLLLLNTDINNFGGLDFSAVIVEMFSYTEIYWFHLHNTVAREIDGILILSVIHLIQFWYETFFSIDIWKAIDILKRKYTWICDMRVNMMREECLYFFSVFQNNIYKWFTCLMFILHNTYILFSI